MSRRAVSPMSAEEIPLPQAKPPAPESLSSVPANAEKQPLRRPPGAANASASNILPIVAGSLLVTSVTALIVVALVDPGAFGGVPLDETTGGDQGGEGGSADGGGGGITIIPPVDGGDDNGGGGNTGDNSTVLDEEGIPCNTSADCPGDHPFDFCAPRYECRAITKTCSTKVLAFPCQELGVENNLVCDEATRACIAPPGDFYAPTSLSGPMFKNGDYTNLATLDLQADEYVLDVLVEFYPGSANLVEQFQWSIPPGPSLNRTSLVIHTNMAIDLGADFATDYGIISMRDWSQFGSVYVEVGNTTSFINGPDFWQYGKFVVIEEPGQQFISDASPNSFVQVRLQWTGDDSTSFRMDYMALEIIDCPTCPTVCSSDSCPLHSTCSTSAGKCICDPGWEGDDCSMQKVPTMLVENSTIYEQYDNRAFHNFYVKVYEDAITYPEYPYTFEDIYFDIDYLDDFEPVLPARVEVTGGSDGQTWGDLHPAGQPNAEFKMRGEFSRRADYHSWKATLKKDWIEPYSATPKRFLGHNRFNFVKSPYDGTRIRHSIWYEMFAEHPYLISWRTSFARLTIEAPNGTVIDWGMNQLVEEGRDKWAEEHGLTADPDSENYCLYKLRNFFFAQFNGTSITDPYAANLTEIEERVDPKGCTDNHWKLIRMLNNFNDFNIPIEDLVNEHVYLPNALTVLAMNVMMYDYDHDGKNAYLLTVPEKDHIFYWIPWDYDGAFGGSSEEKTFKNTLAHYVTEPEHVYWWRILRAYPGAYQMLLDTIDDMHATWLSEASVRARFDSFIPDVFADASGDPNDNKETGSGYYEEVDEIVARINATYDEAVLRLQGPVGIGWATPLNRGSGMWNLNWFEGFSPHGRTVSYDITFSTDQTFADGGQVVHFENVASALTPGADVPFNIGILPSDIDLSGLTSGTSVYVRVETKDSLGLIGAGMVDPVLSCSPPSGFGDTCFVVA